LIGAIRRAFRTPDLRNKLLFTMGILVIFRLGSFIPSPGIDYTKVQECVASPQLNEGGFAMINLFSGGALLQLSIFALGIMPYITASIIVQLLRVVIPALRIPPQGRRVRSGEADPVHSLPHHRPGDPQLDHARGHCPFGRALRRASRGCQDLIANDTWWGIAVLVLTLTAGTGLIMWLGEQITEHGVGNGMSLLIFTSVASAFPSSLGAIFREQGVDIFLIVLAVGLVLVALVVFVEQSQRRVSRPVREADGRAVGCSAAPRPISRSR
jgi:preprotein translocase subunit SecY